MSELLPCPFCGARGEVDNIALENHKRRMTVACSNDLCFAYTPEVFFSTEKEAIAAWNRRVPQQPFHSLSRNEDTSAVRPEIKDE